MVIFRGRRIIIQVDKVVHCRHFIGGSRDPLSQRRIIFDGMGHPVSVGLTPYVKRNSLHILLALTCFPIHIQPAFISSASAFPYADDVSAVSPVIVRVIPVCLCVPALRIVYPVCRIGGPCHLVGQDGPFRYLFCRIGRHDPKLSLKRSLAYIFPQNIFRLTVRFPSGHVLTEAYHFSPCLAADQRPLLQGQVIGLGSASPQLDFPYHVPVGVKLLSPILLRQTFSQDR